MIIEQIYAFSGYQNFVRSFAWRKKYDEGIFQLVSWTKNEELRLSTLDVQYLEACGYTFPIQSTCVLADPLKDELTVSSAGSKYNLSSLKNDFMPVTAPKDAVLLSLAKSTVENPANSTLNSLISDRLSDFTLGESLSPPSTSLQETITLRKDEISDFEKDETSMDMTSIRDCLPCPRISGGSFGGPNILVIFNSCSVLKQVSCNDNVSLLPRTYKGLLALKTRESDNPYQGGIVITFCR